MPLPIAISGASGPSTAPRLRVAKRASEDAGQLDRRDRPAGLEPLGGRVSVVPGR